MWWLSLPTRLINFHLVQTNFPVHGFSPGAPNHVNSRSWAPHLYLAGTWGSDRLSSSIQKARQMTSVFFTSLRHG